MMRGKDGVLVFGIHLMLLGQGKCVGLYDTRLRLQYVTCRIEQDTPMMYTEHHWL